MKPYVKKVQITNLIIVILFLSAILVPFFISGYQFSEKLINPEKKENSTTDKTSSPIELVTTFISKPNSGLICNKDLIKWSNVLKVKYLGYKQINQVVIGKDNWLYVDDRNSMKDHMGLIRLSNEELSSYEKVVEYRRDLLAKLNIPLLLVVAPNKETIYPEYLPELYGQGSNPSKLDQIISYFRANSDIEILDLRGPLSKAKEKYPVYYATDSHWNSYGAFVAYTEIMKKLEAYFPGRPVYTVDDFDIAINSVSSDRDLAALLLMTGMFQDQNVTLKPVNKDITNMSIQKIPHAVIYYDSFYIPVEPWLSPYFDVIHKFRLGTDLPFVGSYIQREKPDIVIYVMVERLVGEFFSPYP